MTITLNTGAIGSSPSVTWVVTWDGSSTTFSITGTKNADGALYNTNTSAKWTCYVGFEGVNYSSVDFYSYTIGFPNGGSSQTKSYTVTTSISSPPLSGTMYFYTTSSNFGSTGVISYANRKQASFYKVTVEDRVDSMSGNLLGSSWSRVPEGSLVSGQDLRTTTYTGYTYYNTTSAAIFSDVTLYRYFTGNSYQVYYDGNDSAGTIGNLPQSGAVSYGSPISSNVPTNTYTVTFNANGGSCSTSSLDSTRAFQSWNTLVSGAGDSYSPGAIMDVTHALYLHAQWGPATSITLPTATRPNFEFLGWSTSSSSSSGSTGSYTPSGNVTLYAIWRENGAVRIFYNGSYHLFSLWLYTGDGGGPNSNGWHQTIPMVYCNANGSTKFHIAG